MKAQIGFAFAILASSLLAQRSFCRLPRWEPYA
jgi:hypothetical protein